jgi:hypothetical protein
MKKYLVALMLFVSAMGTLATPATAAVVSVGSTYSVFFRDSANPEFFGFTEFDDNPAFANLGDLILTLSESETSLGAGVSRITINLSANGELFPSASNALLVAIGVDGDGLDLLTGVSLDNARITFRNAGDSIVHMTDNLAGGVPQNNLWGGFFPAPSNAFDVPNISGRGVTAITFDFLVTELSDLPDPGEVPEPASILLGGTGMLALCTARRRSRRRALPA